MKKNSDDNKLNQNKSPKQTKQTNKRSPVNNSDGNSNQSINQSINQTTNQATNQPTRQKIRDYSNVFVTQNDKLDAGLFQIPNDKFRYHFLETTTTETINNNKRGGLD